MNVVSPEAIGLIFNLLSPSHRDELLDLLKDLAEQQKESPDGKHPVESTSE